MSAPTPAPTTSPRRYAGRSAPTPSMRPSPPRCWPRSSPTQVALALAAAEEVTARRQRSVRAAELAVERARYDADRAERAFLACEPENRLVARTLETRWETRLAGLADAEAALAAQRSAQPELPSPDQLAATIADLPALWAAPDHQRQGPQAAAAHPAGRRDHHPVSQRPRPDRGRAALEIRRQPAGPRSPGAATPSSCAAPTRRRSSSPAASAPAWTTTPWPPR